MRKLVVLVALAGLMLPVTFAAQAGTTSTKKVRKAATSSALVDINSATADQLEKLPGIGAADANKIVEGRPYSSTKELVQKNVLAQASYDQISKLIHAKPLPKQAAKKK
jgi:DNA uptake protein ComE-like DNA-binding protein